MHYSELQAFKHFVISGFISFSPTEKSPKSDGKKIIFVRLTNSGRMAQVRYSDKELKEFKAIIVEKLKEAKEDLELLKGQLDHSDDHGTDDTGRSFNMMEDGSETMSREEIAQLAARQEKFCVNLQNALVRIENKTYGICRVTGKLISKQRLMLVPHATLSIEAKKMQG